MVPFPIFTSAPPLPPWSSPWSAGWKSTEAVEHVETFEDRETAVNFLKTELSWLAIDSPDTLDRDAAMAAARMVATHDNDGSELTVAFGHHTYFLKRGRA